VARFSRRKATTATGYSIDGSSGISVATVEVGVDLTVVVSKEVGGKRPALP
jgi:hypothetical protein